MTNNSDDDNYVEYVPLKRRRANIAKQAALLASKRGVKSLAVAAQNEFQATTTEETKRRKLLSTIAYDNQNVQSSQPTTFIPLVDQSVNKNKSLLDQVATIKANTIPNKKSQQEMEQEEEAQVLAELSRQPALKATAELAHGIEYTQPMKTSWKPPTYLQQAHQSHHDDIREFHRILVEGQDIPPPCISFKEMKLPPPILDEFKRKDIKHPSAIQMQGLPVALSGRDMIGIAYTGSGKTVVFTVPLVMIAWEMERKLNFIGGEGPVGMIVAPSRELARQTYEISCEFCSNISKFGGPSLRNFLAIGGVKIDHDVLRQGIHIVVGTPGRLLDLLRKKTINLESCRGKANDSRGSVRISTAVGY